MNDNNNASDTTFSLRQNELVQKQIKLQVLRDLIEKNAETLRQKKKLLKEESNALDKLHLKVWELQSEMCDKIWDFSIRHDVNAIFNKYPDIPNDLAFDCKCEKDKVPTESIEVQNLRLEIKNLQSDLENQRCGLLEEDLEKAKVELKECRRESSEVQRLNKEIEESKQKVMNLKSRINTNFDKSRNFLTNTNKNFENHSFQSSANFSNLPVTHPKQLKLDALQPLKHVTQMNNFKRKSNELNDSHLKNTGHFVKASEYMKNTENESQNIILRNKITSEIQTNENTTVTKPKKKFVVKTKSLITQRVTR